MDEFRAAAPQPRAGDVPSDAPSHAVAFVHRRALFERIDAHRAAGNAIWIAARAGAGKTALVHGYAAARGLPLVWLGPRSCALRVPGSHVPRSHASPRERRSPDADPAHVLEAFVQTSSWPMSDSVASYPAAKQRGVRRSLDLFLAHLPRPSILFFDDIHEMPVDGLAMVTIQDAVDAAPAGLTVVVGSRRPPPSGFSRLRVSGRLVVLDDATLSLESDEAEALLRQEGVQAPSEVSRMLGLAKGWAAGLVLLARGSRCAPAVPDLAIDYVASEVLDNLPPECRMLLERTAWLPSITEPAAVALTGDPRAPRRLYALARDSGFVHPSAGPPTTYEVHPLVRATLMAGFAQEPGSSPAVRDLHIAAARLLADSGQVDSAVGLLIDAAHWEGVVELVQRHAPDVVGEGRGEMLAVWLQALPPALAENHPWLTFWRGVCALEVDSRRAAIQFESSWQRFERDGSPEGALAACCGMLQALATDPAGADALDLWLDRLVPHLTAVVAKTLSPPMEQLLHDALTVLSRCRPDHELLPPFTERAWRLLDAPGPAIVRLAAGCFVWRQGMGHGDLRAQSRVRLLGEEPAAAPETPRRLRMTWCALEALHLCGVLDFAGARRAIERLRSMVGVAGPGAWSADLGWCYACLAAGTGDPLLAETAVALVADGRCSADAWHRHRSAVIRAVAALLRGDAESARDHVAAEIDVLDRLHAPAAQVTFLQLAAIAFAKCAAHQAADSCLAEAERLASARSLGAETRTGCFVRAFVALQAGDAVAADGALRVGVRLAREQGCPNWGLLLTPAVTARLAGAALAAGIEPVWVREIVRTRGLLPEGPLSDAWPWPIRIHALGRFTVLCRDAEVRFSGRSQRKPMELLETLLALGGRDVGAARVAGALWPQSDGDSAANALGTTLHRLRKLLGEDASITLVDGRLTLDPRLVWVDTWSFERSATECESLVAAGAPPDAIVKSFEVVLSRYRGHFLPANEGGPGVIARRERLHGRFRRVSEMVVEVALARSDGVRADPLCQRILDIDPVAEPIHRALMRSLAAQGRHGEALETCARAERLLMAELGQGLSPATRALRRAISDAAGNADP